MKLQATTKNAKKASRKILTKSSHHKMKEIPLYNTYIKETKHIEMPAKTVTITQGDDSSLHNNKNEHSNKYDILNDFVPPPFSGQQQNVTKIFEKTEENTPILPNFTNKIFLYLSENKNIIGSGLKILFGFN